MIVGVREGVAFGVCVCVGVREWVALCVCVGVREWVACVCVCWGKRVGGVRCVCVCWVVCCGCSREGVAFGVCVRVGVLKSGYGVLCYAGVREWVA